MSESLAKATRRKCAAVFGQKLRQTQELEPRGRFNKNALGSKGDRRARARLTLIVLIIVLIGVVALSFTLGASGASLAKLLELWQIQDFAAVKGSRDYLILIEIRLPRIVMGLLVGAVLAVCGALMQGLFRNPLADPGLMGVSSGAGLGAVIFIVWASFLPPALLQFFGSFALVFGAFVGALLTTFLLYLIATRHGRTSIALLLLAGIAIAALSGAVLGCFIYIADDRQLRDITFWSLGSLAGATWERVGLAAPFIVATLIACPFLARALNGLSLGEAVAGHLGFRVQRIKNISIITVACGCGAAVALSGAIGFIGIVVPHLLRLTIGPDHRFLLPCAALLGAVLLLLADIAARLIIAPADFPIGIITALFGAPFFLFILLRQRGVMD